MDWSSTYGGASFRAGDVSEGDAAAVADSRGRDDRLELDEHNQMSMTLRDSMLTTVPKVGWSLCAARPTIPAVLSTSWKRELQLNSRCMI